MNVHQESELLSAYLDKQLKPDQSARMEEHLKSCASCGSEFNKLQTMKIALGKMTGRTMPGALSTSIKARASEKLSRKSWIDWLLSPQVWVPAAALSLGVAAFTLWMKPAVSEDNEIPVESIMAAHHRYEEEGPVPDSDLSSGNFSAKLASYEGTVE